MWRWCYGWCSCLSSFTYGIRISNCYNRKWQVNFVICFNLKYFIFYENLFLYIVEFRLGGGTTWHTSGLVGAFKPSLAQVKLAQNSIALYKELEEKGLSTGWKQCGSLSLARTRDRMTVFKRMKAQSM